jgi:CubicO group peptidase (beta-lactamase class C family)
MIRVLVIPIFLMLTNPASAQPANQPMAASLEAIRAKYKLPALGGALFTTDGIIDLAAVGVRKLGDTTPVTKDDVWHMGSDTKAMTATLAGTFVAEKKLSWDDKVVSFFPDVANQVPEANRNITLGQVMRHEAGLAENLDWGTLSKTGSLPEQRLAAAKIALTKPAYAPGTFHYANTDFVLVGAILEKIGGKPWEELIAARLFQPLGMNSAGFGGLGTPGKIDQPWPHDAKGVPLSMNGPAVDNPEIVGPAGTVHCSINDWSKFLVDQLRGATGMKALLPNEIYHAIQTPAAGDKVGYGWGVMDQPWSNGKVLIHAGSNTMNYCVACVAPGKKVGLLAVTNEGGDNAAKACNEVLLAFLHEYTIKQK